MDNSDDEVERLKTEIYGRISELDKKTDGLNFQPGITTVEDVEGICFSVDFIYGENASYGGLMVC